jgi:hypothetical protein
VALAACSGFRRFAGGDAVLPLAGRMYRGSERHRQPLRAGKPRGSLYRMGNTILAAASGTPAFTWSSVS